MDLTKTFQPKYLKLHFKVIVLAFFLYVLVKSSFAWCILIHGMTWVPQEGPTHLHFRLYLSQAKQNMGSSQKDTFSQCS